MKIKSVTNTANRSINRSVISLHDFEEALRFLNHIVPTDRDIITESLLISSVIAYARPFTPNEKDSKARAHPRIDLRVISKLSSDERDFHEAILNLRNKGLAHREWSFHPTKTNESGIISTMPFSIFNFFRSQNEIIKFKSLVEQILVNAHNLTANKIGERNV